MGCMMKNRLGIVAGLNLMVAQESIAETGCDGFMLCREPRIELKGGFKQKGNLFTLLDRPGPRVGL